MSSVLGERLDEAPIESIDGERSVVGCRHLSSRQASHCKASHSRRNKRFVAVDPQCAHFRQRDHLPLSPIPRGVSADLPRDGTGRKRCLGLPMPGIPLSAGLHHHSIISIRFSICCIRPSVLLPEPIIMPPWPIVPSSGNPSCRTACRGPSACSLASSACGPSGLSGVHRQSSPWRSDLLNLHFLTFACMALTVCSDDFCRCLCRR